MSYSTIDMAPVAPQTQGPSVFGAVVGTVAGAMVGAVVMAAVSSVQAPAQQLYAPAMTQVRPVVGQVAPMTVNTPVAQAAAAHYAGAPQYASAQEGVQYEQMYAAQPAQGVSVYSWAWVALAAVAGAVNGMFLWNSNKKVAMAATTGRREALMTGVAAAGTMGAAAPAFAAYGDSANVFGKKKDAEQFFTVSGPGWSSLMPGKFNPSKQNNEFPGTVGRWEDNFDQVSNATMVVRSVGKNSITECGSVEDFRNQVIVNLLGVQSWEGKSISEGGFADGQVSTASLLNEGSITKDGKTYYTYELLTRTADGNEGGRHQLFAAAASGGNLYVMKYQAGDKRWFFGLNVLLAKCIDSFTVA